MRGVSGGTRLAPLGALGRCALGRSAGGSSAQGSPGGDQRGTSLVEVLVGLVVMGLTIGGLLAATSTGVLSGASSRALARANSLLTSFSESIKSLPYNVCATASTYQSAFESTDAVGPAERRLSRPGVTLRVTDVEDNSPGSSSCPSSDSGTQVVSMEVSVKGATVAGRVVKRTPLPDADPPTVDFDAVLRSGLNNPFVVFGLRPDVYTPTGVFLFEWWCDAAWAAAVPPGTPPAPDFTSSDPNDPRPQCGPTGFAAPITPATASKVIAMRVTDNAGLTYPVFSKTVSLPSTTSGAQKPTADITLRSALPCTPAQPCNTTTPVEFDGRLSKPGDGQSLVKCTWTFGDGSPAEVVVGPDCGSEANARSHLFVGQGLYRVALTVTDNFGQVHADFIDIEVAGPIRRRPLVVINGSVNGGPMGVALTGVSPQIVQFSSTGSEAYDGAAITSYSWAFGDGNIQSGGTDATYKYMSASLNDNCDGSRGHKAVLTVTDSNGISNSAAMCVTLDELAPPPGLVHTRTRGGLQSFIPLIVYIHFYFQWQRINMTPNTPAGDVTVDLEVSSRLGLSCFMGTKTFSFPRDGETPANLDVQPPSGQPAKTDRIRYTSIGDLFAAWFSNRRNCQYRARTVRAYDGATYQSPWSAFQTFI